MMTLQHRFVEHVPDIMEPGLLYVSITYCTAMHLCACGCGSEVVTPISPTDWQLKFDGRSISLNPSIGNWNFDCRSHYWILKNEIRYAESWTDEKVASGRLNERENKDKYYGSESVKQKEPIGVKQEKNAKSVFEYIKSFFSFTGFNI